MRCGSPGRLACYPTRIGRPSTIASAEHDFSRGSSTRPSPGSHLHQPPPTSTNLHQPPQPPPTSTNLPNALDFFLMSDQLPRLGGLSEPEKYERLVDRVPGAWWSDAGPFAGLHELNAVRVEYFRRVFGGFGGKRVFDVGCGGGILAETLAAEGATVTGIDPSEKSLAAARDHARRSGLTIDYRRGTAEDLGGAALEGTFDLVFAVDVLEHVDDLERTVSGLARVLAPGGGLGFLTHNRTIAGFLQVVWDEEYVQHTMPEGFHDFARFITPAELSDALARHDMVVQEMKGVERAGDGTGRRVLSDDLSVTYLGWALRTR